MSIQSINDLSKLPEHINETTIVAALRTCLKRLDKLEAMAEGRKVMPKKELTYVKTSPYILEVLSNGRVWSYMSIAEQIRVDHPDIAHLIKDNGIRETCGRLYHNGEIEKVNHGVYRKKA